MGRKKRDSGAEGVLLVDKPEGPSSFDIVARARRALKTRAIGHTGTLDPLASGLLVLLVGRYTRLSAHLVSDDKEYEARVCFGMQTNTDDREGEAVKTGDATGLDETVVRAAVAAMVGPAQQVPPMFSAISIGGERLYKKARRGEEVEIPPRDIVFHTLVVMKWDASDPESPTIDVRVQCSKGTYIRAFARDLGAAVGVPAHLSALRRTQSGGYRLDEAATVDDLEETGAACLRVGASQVRGVLACELRPEDVGEIEQGRAIDAADISGAPTGEGEICLGHVDDEPVALLKRSGPHLKVARGFGPAPTPVEPELEAAAPAEPDGGATSA